MGDNITDPNEPAFEPLIWKQMPLTKREYFAALAMQGLLANSHLAEEHGIAWADIAGEARTQADGLIAELNK